MAALSRKSSARAGDRWTILSMLAIVGFLLGLIIFVGWERLIVPFSAETAVPLALLITALAALVARHIGVRWQRETEEAEAENRRPDYRWLSVYPAFFLISALGVINVAFYYLEGPAVLKQNIDEASQSFAVLASTAQADLRNVPHEEKIDRVHQRIAALTQEIESPNGYCGVGPKAHEIIEDIRKDLPAFHEYFGSSTTLHKQPGKRPDTAQNCRSQRLAALADAYRDQADQQLASDPDFARDNGPARERFLRKLGTDLAGGAALFKGARDALDNSDFTRRGEAYGTAKTALETAAASYADDRQMLDRLSRRAHDLPAALDLSPSRDLGSFTTILHSLLRRAGVFTTWIYILFAVAMDFIVLALVKSVHAAFAQQPRSVSERRDSVSAEAGGGPRFLWINPD
jgi:hypothetical protein